MKSLIKSLKLASAVALSVVLPLGVSANVFSDADLEEGVFNSWFGSFETGLEIVPDEGWFFHAEHGYLYFSNFEDFIWFYDVNIDNLGEGFSGWAFSSPEVFPFIYLETADLWVVFAAGVTGPGDTPRVFLETASYSPVLLPKWEYISDVVETALAAADFDSLAAALTRADLVAALQGNGPFTVFAPTDAAFGELDEATLNALLTDDELLGELTNILLYHVVAGELTASDLSYNPESVFSGKVSNFYLETLSGADLMLSVTPLGVIINSTSMVEVADIYTSNGIIHVIDTVLLPPQDIVGVAVAAEFESLVAAVIQAELAEALQSPGPFTVFAPIDEAFAALGQETLDTLFDDENKELLASILTYHVIPGKIYSPQVMAGAEVATLNGAMVTFGLNEEGGLTINGANIIGADVRAFNGVIHIIDSVILPPSEDEEDDGYGYGE